MLIMPPSTHHAAQAIICFPLHHGFNQVNQTQAGPPCHQAAGRRDGSGSENKTCEDKSHHRRPDGGGNCVLLAVLVSIITCTKV